MRRTLLAAALITLVTGCGSQTPATGVASVTTASASAAPAASPTGTVDPEEQRRKFAQCMRDNGVDMPDPGADGNMRVIKKGSADGKKMEQAMEACREHAPFKNRGELSQEDLDRMREFARCMRENGVDMPDPDPDGGAAMMKARPAGPGFEKAMEACEDKLPENGIRK